MKELMGAINLKKAAEGNKIEMWVDPEKYLDIADTHFVRLIILSVLSCADKGSFVCRV